MKTFSIYETVTNKKPCWCLDITHVDDRRQRIYRATKKECEAELNALQTQVKEGGAIWTSLSSHEQADQMLVRAEAKQIGVSLRDVLEFYKKNAKEIHARVPINLGAMIELTLQTKIKERRAADYIRNIEDVLRHFAKEREDMLVSDITPELIKNWLDQQHSKKDSNLPASPFTINSLIGRLSAMFAVAVDGKYLKENPCDELKRLDTSKVEVVHFLLPGEASDLLWVCRQTDRRFLPYVVIGLFAGVRPEECEKLQWTHVRMQDREIYVPITITKTRARAIPINDTLYAWLLECDRTSDPYIFPAAKTEIVARQHQDISGQVRVCRENLCERAGITWHSDLLRKTACTYLMAKHQNENLVSYWLANSPKVIRAHYNGIAGRTDMEKFWALTPTTVPNDKIVAVFGKGIKRPGKLIHHAEIIPLPKVA